jgi:hypothetical protein
VILRQAVQDQHRSFVTRSLRSSETSDGRAEEICRDVPEGQQRVEALVEAPSLIREIGADPTDIAASVGLELAALHDPENSIPFSTAVGPLQAAAVRTGCAHFRLLLGQRNAPSRLPNADARSVHDAASRRDHGSPRRDHGSPGRHNDSGTNRSSDDATGANHARSTIDHGVGFVHREGE